MAEHSDFRYLVDMGGCLVPSRTCRTGQRREVFLCHVEKSPVETWFRMGWSLGEEDAGHPGSVVSM